MAATEQDFEALVGMDNGEKKNSYKLEFTEELNEQKVNSRLDGFESEWKKGSTIWTKNLSNHWNAYKLQEITVNGRPIKIPIVYQLVETFIPFLSNSLFAQSEVIDAQAKFDDPNGEQGYKIKQWNNNMFKTVQNGQQKGEDLIKAFLIYGFCFFKKFWDSKTEFDINPENGELIPQESSHPNFELLDPWNIAFDTKNKTHDIQNCEFLRERKFISKEKLLIMRDNNECAWFDEDDIKKHAINVDKSEKKKTEQYYYDEYQCDMYWKEEDPLTGKKIQKSGIYLVWRIGDNKIIKFEKLVFPQKMWGLTVDISNPFDMLGSGEAEMAMPIAQYVSMTGFQLANLTKRTGERLALVSPDAGLAADDLNRALNGAMMISMDKQNISFEPTNDANDVRVLMENIKFWKEMLDEVSGASKALSGVTIGDVTATEATFVFQNATTRLSSKLYHLQQEFIKNIAESNFMITKMLMSRNVYFITTNNQMMDLSPADFAGNYEWKATGSIMQANKALKAQQNSAFLQQLIQLQQYSMNTPTPFIIDIPVYIQKYIAPWNDFENVFEFIKPAPQPPQEIPPQEPPIQ